jgi:hypothetical protein
MNTSGIQMYSRIARLTGWLTILLAGAVLLLPAAQAEEAAPFPVYKPPSRGAPVARVGGGTRGAEDDQPSIYVLTPEHMGLTSRAQPALFWYVSQSVPVRFDFVLISDKGYEPLVETRLKGVESAGIHRISLSDYNVTLEPGVSYQWSVALVSDTEQRSGDVFASGEIERIDPPAGIKRRFEIAKGEELVAQYASTGLWYDALQELTAQIEADPGNTRLQQVRAALLRQVGLDEVAAYVAR